VVEMAFQMTWALHSRVAEDRRERREPYYRSHKELSGLNQQNTVVDVNRVGEKIENFRDRQIVKNEIYGVAERVLNGSNIESVDWLRWWGAEDIGSTWKDRDRESCPRGIVRRNDAETRRVERALD